MSGEIYIADKATLDQVKTNTDNILLKSNTKYNPIAYRNGSFSLGVYTEILNINGKGFLSKCCGFPNATSKIMGFKIFVDNVLIAYIQNVVSVNMVSGFVMTKHILHNVKPSTPICYSTDLLVSNTETFLSSLSENLQYGVLVLDTPIYFENNLRIEVLANNSTSRIEILGGLEY